MLKDKLIEDYTYYKDEREKIRKLMKDSNSENDRAFYRPQLDVLYALMLNLELLIQLERKSLKDL